MTLFKIKGRKKCRDVWPNEPIEYEKIFTIFLDFFLLIVPLIVLTAAYSMISRTLWRSMDEEKVYIEQIPSMKMRKQKFMSSHAHIMIREGRSAHIHYLTSYHKYFLCTRSQVTLIRSEINSRGYQVVKMATT